MTSRRAPLALAPDPAPGALARVALARDDGEAMLRRAGLAGLRAALAPLLQRPAVAAGSLTGAPIDGWTLFWVGYVQQFENLLRARATWLAAEAQFAAEGDEAGLDLAACALTLCASFDNQNVDADCNRQQRLRRRAAAPGGDSPLALFELTARLLSLDELEDGPANASEWVLRAMAALSCDLDPELRLRPATAALHACGQALDRVLADDLIQAGARVAALPLVGDYSRAFWHLYVAESRFVDERWAKRLGDELELARQCAGRAGAGSLGSRADLLSAAQALSRGDLGEAAAHLDSAHSGLEPGYSCDYAVYHYFRSRYELQAGHPSEALEHASASRSASQAGGNPDEATPLTMQRAFVLVALGRLEEAQAEFARAGARSQGAQVVPCTCHAHLTRALACWREGLEEEARAELRAGFAQAGSIGLLHFFRALPREAAQLCGAALELGADPDFARKVIAARALHSPDAGIASWPWPVHLRLLGGLVIECDGRALAFGRKAPKRLLDLLRLVIALGGRGVDMARVAATLWPDAGGGEDRDALRTMLHRARALIGAEVLHVREGQISIDERQAWVDTWAFEHVCSRIESLLVPGASPHQPIDDAQLAWRQRQLLGLYRGHFLGEADVPAWALPLRDRLRARYIRAVDALGQRLERCGHQEQAIALYRAALEQDNLAEEIYQHLIACHLARGESAQALNAYRRCRELLSVVLGVRPSARTEAMMAPLRQARAG